MREDIHEFDVAVIGGSIAGGATALQLLRGRQGLKVLVVERQAEFGRRVGESTVELSTFFLTRVLGLTRHLNERHVVKQGFRYWFTNAEASDMGACTEMGGRYLTRIGSYQVDRVELDAEVLRRVESAGGEVWRPASVRSVELEEGGTQRLTVRMDDGEERAVAARWVVDASGRQAVVARQRGEVEPIEGHPTAAVWARWKGTLDFDGAELIERYPALGRGFFGTRHTATNHIVGDGWWAWVIPLKGGHTSVGVTWDQRLFRWPREQGGTLGEQLRAVLETHPTGRELLADAELVESDVHVRRNLPYRCKTPIGDGFLLVGDAAGFIDPFYSMGLDYLAMTSISGTGVILAERVAAAEAEPGLDAATMPNTAWRQQLERHRRIVDRSLPRWYEGIFRDKYVYMGDYELMRVAFLVDISLYYFGLVMPPYKRGRGTVCDGMFAVPAAWPFYVFMSWVNRRLAAIGASRRRRGTFGRRNAGRRMLVPGFAFDVSIPKGVVKALGAMLWLELVEGWRCWRPRRASDGSLDLVGLSGTPGATNGAAPPNADALAKSDLSESVNSTPTTPAPASAVG
ncbi:MAG: NAD(P)/FAD-dependent oxidoreductase [Planctomycetota bacterium]